MARELKLDIGSDAAAARANLAATARAVDHLADEADRLEKEFEQATRAAGKLDRQLLETKAAAAALSKEFAETGDKKLVAQIREQEKAAAEIKRIQKTIVGDSEKQSSAARKAWSKLFDTFGGVGGHGAGFSGLPGQFVDALSNSGLPLVSTLAKHPALAAAATPAIAGTAILAGATAGGLVTAGVGAGVAGVGVAGAALQSEKVRSIWAETTADIKRQFLDATTSFEGPTISAISKIGAAFHDVDMKKIFSDASKFVEPLTDGAAKALRFIGQGVEYLVARGGPAIGALATGIAGLGQAVETAMEKIGDGSAGGAKAIDDVFSAISDLIVLTGTWIGWFEDAYDAVDNFTDKLREVHPVIGAFGEVFDPEQPKVIARTLNSAADAADKAGGSFRFLTSGLADMTSETNLANAAFDRMFGIMMDVDQANLAVKLGLASLRDAMKDGSSTRDELTEKVLRQIQLLEDQRQAELATGDGSKAATDRINANYQSQLEALKRLVPWLDGFIDKYEKLSEPVTKHIYVVIDQVGSVSSQGVISGGDQRTRVGAAYASGTRYAAPGWAWAGEEGPELINFGGGEEVYTADQSAAMAMAAPAGSGGATQFAAPAQRTVTFAGNVDSAFATAFMRLIREGLITIG